MIGFFTRELRRAVLALMCAAGALFAFTLTPHPADAQSRAESADTSKSQQRDALPTIERQGRFIVEATPLPARPANVQNIAAQITGAANPLSAPAGFDVVRPVLLEQPLAFGYYFWDERALKASGRSGPIRVVVDLDAEQLYVYRSGMEIARTRITRGWAEHQTPTGVFPILEKDKDHYSSTYDDAPMPFNLRLTWPGVAIHGADVDNVSGTHGCIGVPLEFAEMLFANTRLGDTVLITDRWRPDIYGV